MEYSEIIKEFAAWTGNTNDGKSILFTMDKDWHGKVVLSMYPQNTHKYVRNVYHAIRVMESFGFVPSFAIYHNPALSYGDVYIEESLIDGSYLVVGKFSSVEKAYKWVEKYKHKGEYLKRSVWVYSDRDEIPSQEIMSFEKKT